MRRIISLITCLFLIQVAGFSQFDYLADMEKVMVKVGNKLYASRYEITNSQYNMFFTYLVENNMMRELEIAWPDTSQWIQAGSEYMPLARIYRWYPTYSSYPACNISYEAVLLFCDWLTEQYMSYPERIFQNVKFRLPSEYEWMNAARGGIANLVYPWGTDSPTNDEGNPLCNFWLEVKEGTEEETNSEFSSVLEPVKSYFPNGFGLYNISGNVAEMINQRGVAKGGSWRSNGEEIRIDAKQRYDGPSPFVGFRIYMDVLEE
jgi:formylglycine-generating enzyme required for sulfatase activity